MPQGSGARLWSTTIIDTDKDMRGFGLANLGDVDIGLNRFLTSNLQLRQPIPGAAVISLEDRTTGAPGARRDLIGRYLDAVWAVRSVTLSTHYTIDGRFHPRDEDGASMRFLARDTGAGLVDIARLQGADEPRFQYVLPPNLRDAGTLAISAGTITVGVAAGTAWYKVDTEALAASDELDRIDGGTIGDVIFLVPANDTRTVILRDYRTAGVVAGANIRMGGAGVTFSLDALGDIAGLLFDGSRWNMIARESNG